MHLATDHNIVVELHDCVTQRHQMAAQINNTLMETLRLQPSQTLMLGINIE